MGYGKGKTEGGHKRGHSAMAFWVTHQEAKTEARKRRRLASRHLEQKVVKEADGRREHNAMPRLRAVFCM